MAQQLGAHTALAEDPSWVPSTNVGWLTTASNSSSQEMRYLYTPVGICTQVHT